MITADDLVLAIRARELPLHIAIELSSSHALAELWANERDVERMSELLEAVGAPLPITVAIEAATLAMNRAGSRSDYAAATDYLATARLVASSRPRSHGHTPLDIKFEHARLAAGENFGAARARMLAVRQSGFEGAQAQATALKSAWGAVVMTMTAVTTYIRGMYPHVQIAQAISRANEVFDHGTDNQSAIPNLIRRDFGPPTLEQIVAAMSR